LERNFSLNNNIMLANWGIFKITERKYWKENPEYIYFDLDSWFNFFNSKSNAIWCANQEPFKDWKVGDTIRIDLNWLMWKDTTRHDCTIKSVEVAQLVDETKLPRIQAENLFSGSFYSQSQLPVFNLSNLPPVWAVETGNYQWSTENNEEFQATIQQQQHFPPKKK
jgi:hypothetical protein